MLVLPSPSRGHSTPGSTSIKDSDERHSYQRGRDSERGTLPQWRVSTALG